MDKRTLQRIRIPLGFLFAVVFLIFARPSVTSITLGSGIAFIGLAIRAWASGHIRKARVLAVTGPYAYTRNPLYLGTFFLGLGFTVASGVWWLSLFFAALFVGIYLPVMRVEADDIHRIFGRDFDEYARNVPVFIPRLTSLKKSPRKKEAEKFDFGLYLQYREYRAALGAIAAIGVLAAKAYFLQ